MILKLKISNFTNIKALFLINNIDTNKKVVSNKVSLSKKGLKDFIGYKDGKKN